MKITLEAWAKDASSILSGDNMFSEDIVKVNKDCVYDCLIAPSDNPLLESYTQMALEICCGGMPIILERQAKDQLPGGKYLALDLDTVSLLKSVPTINTISERDFAQLDMLMRIKPSASTTTYEAI
jgi:E1A/CREB-binding protein